MFNLYPIFFLKFIYRVTKMLEFRVDNFTRQQILQKNNFIYYIIQLNANY